MREIVLDTETTGLDPLGATGWLKSAASRHSTGVPTIDLIGARQSQLILAAETRDSRIGGHGETPRRQREVPLAPRVTEADRAAHRSFIATLGDKPVWNDFLGV